MGPEGAFAALVPKGTAQVNVTALPTEAGALQAMEALIADEDVAEVRWIDRETLEVTLEGPGAVTLRDGGPDGPVVATASAPAEGAASMRGKMPVHLVVRGAAAGDDETRARTRAQLLVADEWDRGPHELAGPGPVALAPDRAAAAAVADGDVWLVDLGSGAVTALPVGDAVDVGLTADRLLVSRSNGLLDIRDRATHAVVTSVRGAAALGGSLVTTPDGSLAARLSRDGTAEVVDVVRGGVLGVVGPPTQILYGMQPGLALSPDGALLLVAYTDPGQDGWGTLDAYDLAPDRLLQVACATAGRDLTAADWRQFVNEAVPDDLRCIR